MLAAKENIRLVYAARDGKHNSAVALRKLT